MKLKDVFNSWQSHAGIFSILEDLFPMPWADRQGELELDLDYFGLHGNREISPIVKSLLNDDGELTDGNKARLARIIYNRFGVQWGKLYNTLSLEYNPISNYDMTETEHIDDEIGRRNQLTNDTKSTTDNDTYGFNSITPIPNDRIRLSSGVTTNGEEKTDRGTDRRLTRSGNIGVTTSQQMLQSERDIWLWDFFKTVYNNVNEVLTIPYYKY